jgi:hypothetical protein
MLSDSPRNRDTQAITVDVTEYANVGKKIVDLGCRCPDRMALLPVNFESATSITELLQASEAATVRKLFLAAGLPLDEIVDRSLRPPYLKKKSFEWVAPILFVSAALYSQNPDLVSLALNIMGNYATEFLKGTGGTRSVKVDIVVEKRRNETYKRISYQGPPAGLKDLSGVIREVVNE